MKILFKFTKHKKLIKNKKNLIVCDYGNENLIEN